jgi:hypothetical protein
MLFRFWSDTNQAGFTEQLRKRRVLFDDDGYVVKVDEPEAWVEGLAADYGATVEKDEAQTTSGVDGFLDTSAVSTRSNPPPEIRGEAPQQLVANIAQTIGVKPKTQRRKTRGQP